MNNVVINATNIGRRLDGISVYTLNLLRELSKLETDVNFLVFLNRNSKYYLNDIRFPENFSIKWTANITSPDYGAKGHILRLIYSNFLSLKNKKSLILNTSQLEAMFFRSAQVITIHDITPLLFKKEHKKQYYYFKYILKHALNTAKCIIAPSNHTKQLIGSFYNIPGDKIRVIYNGIRGEFLQASKNINAEQENYILFAGRLAPTKNLKGLLKAFELIKRKIDHKLVIVGSGKKAFKKGLTDNQGIVFKGYISGAELFHLYKKASLFVFPSFHEGFGLPPLEAMACGCPVVVSNAASLPEVCGDAAYYVDPNDAESIAEGMHKVLTDEALRQNLIEKGLQRAKLFSWEKSAKEHLKVFKEILNS